MIFFFDIFSGHFRPKIFEIFNPAKSRAALVQQIQPGSGIYMSGIEIDTTAERIHNKMNHQKNVECTHSTVTGKCRLYFLACSLKYMFDAYQSYDIIIHVA